MKRLRLGAIIHFIIAIGPHPLFLPLSYGVTITALKGDEANPRHLISVGNSWISLSVSKSS